MTEPSNPLENRISQSPDLASSQAIPESTGSNNRVRPSQETRPRLDDIPPDNGCELASKCLAKETAERFSVTERTVFRVLARSNETVSGKKVGACR